MTTKVGWFEVDKDGLAKLLRRKGISFILYELLQNAWDTNASRVVVELSAVPDHRLVHIRIEDDDPDGFKNLDHGFRLFAESEKKRNPNQRGRFNLGEKLVLSMCDSARLSSTTGTIHFEMEGKELIRRHTREKRQCGTVFEADLRITRAELTELIEAAGYLLPPIPTIINDLEVTPATPIHTFEATLPTEYADEEGYLRRGPRKTTVRIHEKIGMGEAYIYEMGIPVVEVELPWSVEIMQKIPLNADRDNVTPSYRKALAVLVLNEMHGYLSREDASRPLIQEALESPDVSVDAVRAVITHRHGSQRVAFDPSDPEANQNAVAHGYNIVHGGTYNRAQWDNIRRAEAAIPSGQLFPTPKAYNPEGVPARIIHENEWTPGMKAVADFAKTLAREIMDLTLHVVMENERSQPYVANYGGKCLTFNVPKLGRSWFDLKENFEKILDLIIHEFGHQYASSHLDAKYHDALTRLAAQTTTLALRNPGLFRRFGAS